MKREDNDELTAAYLAGCYDTRKAYEQRLAEADELKEKFKTAMATYELTGFDDSLWELLDTLTKGE